MWFFYIHSYHAISPYLVQREQFYTLCQFGELSGNLKS